MSRRPDSPECPRALQLSRSPPGPGKPPSPRPRSQMPASRSPPSPPSAAPPPRARICSPWPAARQTPVPPSRPPRSCAFSDSIPWCRRQALAGKTGNDGVVARFLVACGSFKAFFLSLAQAKIMPNYFAGSKNSLGRGVISTVRISDKTVLGSQSGSRRSIECYRFYPFEGPCSRTHIAHNSEK